MKPSAATADGSRYGRPPFAAGQRLFVLLCAGLIFVPLMFLTAWFGLALIAWNIFVALLYAADLRRLPQASELSIERNFDGVLNQLQPSRVTLTLANASARALRCTLIDDAPQSLTLLPPELSVDVPAKASASVSYEIRPPQRGDSNFGRAYLRYESPLRIAQAWADFEVSESVRVYPMLKDRDRQQAVLLRSRQIELQRRLFRQRGHGREFESLREFQTGDELRDICWTATARRSRLVTTVRQSERSQTIWTVVDCGRLMRARMDDRLAPAAGSAALPERLAPAAGSAALPERLAPAAGSAALPERLAPAAGSAALPERLMPGRSKLDYAAETAMRLAQLANYGGDASALLAYGTKIQQRRLGGRGSQHLHAMLDQLALLQEESAEADHLHAAATLLTHQKRRAMIVWITDLADLAITPEVVTAALQAGKRHFVVVAVLGQPDVIRLTESAPSDAQQTFLYAAASETLRRRELMLARLRSRGVHAIEVNAPQLTGAVLNKYLEVKQKNLI